MSQVKICPQCSEEYPLDVRFCAKDGSTLKLQGGGSADLVGSIIADRYHVLRKLGEGGMGQVYLAEHVKMGRKSAVKVMNPGMGSDADAVSRFNREAANASRISHPNVAAVYDFGETSDGVIYLAMEFIEGPPLTKLIEQHGALAPMRAAEITRQASEALAVAHDMGIVHRDLKPDNIMIAKAREGGDLVKVVDFGIAKAANNDAQKVTKTGLVVGTPEYMSPEQLAGDKLDGRSDIYSLALVAFNMLTGKLPFPADTVQESMIMRLTDKPRTLSEMKPNAAWTAEVQAVLDRALQRDASQRYQSAADFGRDLLRAMRQMPESVVAEGATQVLGATPIPTDVPATRVARSSSATVAVDAVASKPVPKGSTPAASSAAPAAKKKMPVAAIAAGLVVVLGGGVAALTMRGRSPSPADSPTVMPAGKPAAATAAATSPATQTTAPVAANVTFMLDQLEDLTNIERGASATSADSALRVLATIETQIANDEDLVHARVIKAEALLLKDQGAEACRVLSDIEGKSQKTKRAARVKALLRAC